MGHKMKRTQNDVQKQQLKSIFNLMLATTREILRFQLNLVKNEDEKKGIKKLMRNCDKAQEIVATINHIEILISLYNSFISQKESYFVMLSATINRKKLIDKWDKTEDGFKEFVELETQARAKSKEDYEEKLKLQEMMQKAKQDGKKVEMIYKDGKLQPTIVEDKPN